LSTARKMVSFWQNQPEMANHNDHKNALEDINYIGTSCTCIKAKIEQADALNSQNKLEKAYEIYKDIIGGNSGHADALFGIGVILEKQQKFDLAIEFLSKAIESNPGKTQALLMRGRILRLKGMFENSISDFTEVITKQQDNLEALIARGITFGQAGMFKLAIDDFCMAIKFNPDCAEAFYNRGVIYDKLLQFDAAIEDYSITIKLKPRDYKAYNNRGVARRETKCFDGARKDFEKSVEINPDFVEGYFNKSLTLLSVGNLKEGFKLYEYRWKTGGFQSQVRHFSQQLWLGKEDLTGKTILLHSEQGLGDSIQFCRFIKSFENIKCRVLLEIEKPLMNIMRSVLPQEQIFEKNSKLPGFDFHCPLMSLPLALEAFSYNKLVTKPYVFPENARVEYWQQRLGKKFRPRVGIVWRGNPNHPKDIKRSANLCEFIHKLSREIDWLSLQCDLSADDHLLLNNTKRARDLGSNLKDFSETAAIGENLDLAICIDSSAAHLLGAMGKPVNLILPYSADFRWQSSSSSAPWYPTHTLTRAKKNQNVSQVFAAQVEQAVRNLLPYS
jgi:tetratricopeptide (TPR) repeat protein